MHRDARLDVRKEIEDAGEDDEGAKSAGGTKQVVATLKMMVYPDRIEV